MRVPYQLRRLPLSEPAIALLLPGHQPAELFRLLAELALDPLPAVHAVADGFLIKLPAPLAVSPPGALRLRGLAPDLLIPADAELVPPLLPDEAGGLVKQRGLVFLPGPRVWEYAPGQPVALPALVRPERVQRSGWRTLPAVPELADTVTEIALEMPDVPPEELLEPGRADIGSESPEPGGGSAAGRAVGQALFGLGKGMAWLGQKLSLPGLAGAGAALLGSALALAPRLSEQLMGKQEAMLRDLLRDFRAGNIDQALRRALPLGAEGRGGLPAQDARLPAHRLFYSLLDLLAGSGGGPASLWFTPGDTYQALVQEYRKQAEAATRRGDFRRAAFIYGRLLNDFRGAAQVLASGGLHRDAAQIYEKKVKDLAAAARAWEAAGEVDRAVLLLRKLGDHGAAGDVLRRAGEEERAIDEYRLAAAQLVAAGPRFYEAGELLRTRAERPDLALDYYRQGWQARPEGTPLPCALRLAQHHAHAAEMRPLWQLLDEADDFLEANSADAAASFYNEIARLAGTPRLEASADDLRDRALYRLARKLGQNVQSDSTAKAAAAVLFTNQAWPVPLKRDAEYAALHWRPRPVAPVKPTYRTLQAGSGRVTAACQMPVDGEIVVGFEDGEIAVYMPRFNGVQTIGHVCGPLLSLVAGQDGNTIAVLRRVPPSGDADLQVYRCTGCFQLVAESRLPPEPIWLCSHHPRGVGAYLAFCADGKFFILRYPDLVCLWSIRSNHFNFSSEPVAALFGPMGNDASVYSLLAYFDDGEGELWPPTVREKGSAENCWKNSIRVRAPWIPGKPGDIVLNSSPRPRDLQETASEFYGLDREGNLHRTTVAGLEGMVETTTYRHPEHGPYLAFAWLGGDHFAAVHEHGIDWCAGGRVRRQTPIALGEPIAAFALKGGDELAIVSADGTLTFSPTG